MTEDRWLELPEHVVAKIRKVLGIPPTELPQCNLVDLIEELCDTALMFDREEREGGQAPQEDPPDEPADAPQPSPEDIP